MKKKGGTAKRTYILHRTTMEVMQERFLFQRADLDWRRERIHWFGVRDGNDGIDSRMSFRLLLTLGDKPPPLWGGDTLFWLGEDDWTPPSGDPPPWRKSGISSSLMVSNFGGGGRKLDFPNPCLGRKLEEEEAMEGNEDLGGFFFEENGSWADSLGDGIEKKMFTLGDSFHR